jgi:hypothetical protein
MIKVNDSDKRFPISNTNKADKPLCEKDDRIKCFIRLLEEKGFIVQEGSLQYIDILKLVSEGKSSTALGNIVGAPYATYLLPPAPNQRPSPGSSRQKAMILITQTITLSGLIILPMEPLETF